MTTPTPKDNLRHKKVKAYAQAFVNVIRGGEGFDETAVACETLADIFFKTPDLKRLLANTHQSAEVKKSVLQAVCDKAGLGAEVEGLIGALADAGDLALLPEVIGQVLHATREEIVVAHVKTAWPLTPDQAQNLKESLQDKFNKRVRLKVESDAELIGGVKVQVGDTVIDASLQGKLARLRDDLRKPPSP